MLKHVEMREPREVSPGRYKNIFFNLLLHVLLLLLLF